MLCSECSKAVKPVVAVDIDGTLGDYHGHFIRFAASYLGVKSPSFDYYGVGLFKTWFIERYKIDERTWYDIKLAYRQGGMKRSMPVYPGAAMLCHMIRSAGAELWLTTTRPFLRLDNVDPDTRFWLDQQAIEYDGLLYDEDKYKVLAERLDGRRVVAVLDDLPEQFEAASSAFHWKVPLLRRNPYNTAVVCEQTVKDLGKAWPIIAERIDRWKELHEDHHVTGQQRQEQRDRTRSAAR
jgi:hypothetical protein